MKKKKYEKPRMTKAETPQERYLLKRPFQAVRNVIRKIGKRNGKP